MILAVVVVHVTLLKANELYDSKELYNLIMSGMRLRPTS